MSAEERRLQRIFRRAALVAAALPLACAVESASSTTGGDPGVEPPDAGTAAEPDASSEPPSGLGSVVAQEPGAAHPSPCAPVEVTPNPPDACGNYVRLPCGLPAGVTPGTNCYLWLNDCHKVCPGLYFNCHATEAYCADGGIVADHTGAVEIDCATCSNGVGRVPAGLARARMARPLSALGEHFAIMAHLEAASVEAFGRLHGELAVHGAPARLLRASRRARRDEVRHARLTGRMARRFGGAPARPRVEEVPARALDAVAIENALEGCVRETYGALVATWQASNAADPEIARLMRGIARDETRHAALSWEIARWASRRLDTGARARLGACCRAAIAGLRCEANAAPAGDLVTRAGLPDAAQHRALVRALEEQLWPRLVAADLTPQPRAGG